MIFMNGLLFLFQRVKKSSASSSPRPGSFSRSFSRSFSGGGG